MGEAPLSLPPACLTPWRCYALYHLRAAKTPLTRAALALILDSSQSSAGALLQGLRADGLVRRLDNGEQTYAVTDEGIALVDAYFASMAALEGLWRSAGKASPRPPAAAHAPTVSDNWRTS
jgi:hypothetical protein